MTEINRNYNIKDIVKNIGTYTDLSREEKEHLNLISVFDVKDSKGNKKSDEKLDTEELMNFLKYLSTSCKSLFNKIQNYRVKDNLTDNTQNPDLYHIDESYLKSKPPLSDKETVSKIKIAEDINTAIKTLGDKKGYNTTPLNEKEIKYWTNIIYENSKKYEIAPEILTTILAIECEFKNGRVNKNTGATGPMQVMKISIQDFTEGAQGSRNKTYKLFAENSLNDIASHLKKIGKQNTVSNILQECKNNSDFGVKVGIIIFKMKYLEAINRKNIKGTIETVKEKIPKNQEEYIKKALKSYCNGSQAYLNHTTEILKELGFNYNQKII